MQALCFEEEIHSEPRGANALQRPYREHGQVWVELSLHSGRECETADALLCAAREARYPFARWNAMKSVSAANGEPVLLKVSAPFSALMQAARSDRMFAWLGRRPEQMYSALTLMCEATAEACADAVCRGARVISLADPCAMPELLGEKRFRAFAADFTVRLLRTLLPQADGAVIHLCPRLSHVMEHMGALTAEQIDLGDGVYARQVVRQAVRGGVRLMGHHCIHDPRAGHIDGFALRLKP